MCRTIFVPDIKRLLEAGSNIKIYLVELKISDSHNYKEAMFFFMTHYLTRTRDKVVLYIMVINSPPPTLQSVI